MQFVCEDTVFLPNAEELNMKHKILLSIFALLLSLSAFSGPARRGPVYLTQPDGTAFSARIRGDEFMKIFTTEAGNAIIQGKDGWWCYAEYDSEGRRISSGHRVGTETPAETIASSRNIPFSKLAANAKAKRVISPEAGEPLMQRILKSKGISTKNDGSQSVTKHGIIILAQFKDKQFTYTREDFIALLTKAGYNANGATGSAKEYFDDQFGGMFEFSFDVSPIVTLSGNMAAYGANDPDDSDTAPEEMVIEACSLLDNEIDFSLYDDDGDDEVDNVFVFFAGGDEAEGAGEDCIWSHAWYIYSGARKDLFLDGKRIDRYACTAELSRRYTTGSDYRDVLAGIGTFCHEYFHTFGIPDMYDTDYEGSGGTAAGLWISTSLMDAGNQNNYGNTPPNLNAIERELLGITEPLVIDKNGGYALEPIHLKGQYFRINTDHPDEYYLLECREEEGWDKYAGGRGMLVYHIDKSDRSPGISDNYGKDATARLSWDVYNEVNSRPSHQCADLIEADSRKDSFSATETDYFHNAVGNIRDIFFPNQKTNSIIPGNKPELIYWSGAENEISITNIRESGNGVSFNVLGFSEAILPPNVSKCSYESFMDAAIIRFESDRPFEGEAVVEWGRTGEEPQTTTVKPYESGKYSITLENLLPDNKTYSVKIYFEQDSITGEEHKISFMTKKKPGVSWPFIYMNGIVKNSNGTLPTGCELPLRVYNAVGAAEISWEFNGSPVKAGGDGYFKPSRNGSLVARIIWEDGTVETIMKEIIME